MKLVKLFFLLFIINYGSQKTKDYDIVNAAVKNIETTSSSYILYLQNDNSKFIVPVSKYCEKKGKKRIEVGGKYSFHLKKDISIGNIEEEIFSQKVDDKVVWTADMKNTIYYDQCENACGLYIQ
ncbi:hypothetical protein [Chryseobacterium indoltheticum]|uniref:Uncharacterized protein n=1 Tax=Chryseobacterium indoltheticum TaxID=254 RepID=A0A381FBJ8_9FLAO|nr:hypothetical protein [Chryseobacterium indoltheticum]AZA73714.1 hypothetical protein EG358_08080 [Chryseobacterium indoltheticum]SIQ92622.1 hypothetical protein SAMN05421682_11051 [Chryseobacterium indoltheticum]SUX43834.1 Uncharacterised protein [Chryseobacterium indoltheticum]